jgi:hypothetical protein
MEIKSEGNGILPYKKEKYILFYPLIPCGHSKQIITTVNERNDKYESSIQY